MLEKNLPTTSKIATKLRIEVEEFKEKVPIINFLRNPALKTVSWFVCDIEINVI